MMDEEESTMRPLPFACVLLFATACAPSSETVTPPLVLEYETTGGGDRHFTVSRLNNAFTITVDRNDFKATSFTITLSKSDDAELFQFIDDLASARIPATASEKAQNLPTGSWTTIQVMRNGNKVPVTDAAAIEKARGLYDFVSKRLETGGQNSP
jgi:hypothetical protein